MTNGNLEKSFCKGDIPDVEWVWEEGLPRRRCVRIKLPTMSKDESPEDFATVQDDTTHLSKNEKSLSVEEEDGHKIPESVLVYEQQLRKRQAAKKAGAPATLDQLHVVYVDDDLVVVNKPSGMLCVPGLNDNPSLLSLVHETFAKPSADFGNNHNNMNPNGMIVHRLDMDTSGLVVFGRTPAVVSYLHQQFRDRKVQKEYEALVCGHVHFHDEHPTTTCAAVNNEHGTDHADTQMAPLSGLINLPLQRDHERPPFMRVATPTSERAATLAVADLQRHGFKKLIRKQPKPSQTEFLVVAYEHLLPTNSTKITQSVTKLTTIPVAATARNASMSTGPQQQQQLPVTRLTLIPHTGRTHQLRVHCAAMGHAILGDPAYGLLGEANPNGGLQDDIMKCAFSFRATTALQNAIRHVHDPTGTPPSPMCLHAKLLGLCHPTTGEYMLWESPAPF